MGRKILTIDDDHAGCRLVKAIFASDGFEVVFAHDGRTGLASATVELPDIVLLDMGLPDMEGIEVLEALKAASPELPVIMLSARRELRGAVRATQLGAADYLTKPVDHDELTRVLRRVLETSDLKREVEELRRQVGERGGLGFQMGPSDAAREVIEQVRVVSASNFTVLVLGETGTGKEIVAQAIHRESERRSHPFVALDCGAIPEQLLESELFGHEKGAFTGAAQRKAGRFQLAEGGTFFLDEVGNLPMNLQAKLLRVLESRQVQPVGGSRAASLDVRFVAATNHDLQKRVADGQFRADLYFRLAQYTITLPALRERSADIGYLTRRFLDEARVELRRPVQEILPDALELLQHHRWPGNVRELRNVVRQAVLEAKNLVIGRDVIRRLIGKAGTAQSAASAPGSARAERSLKEIAEAAAQVAERQAICDTLRATGGNKSQAARALKTDYKTLHLKMKKFGVNGHDFGA